MLLFNKNRLYHSPFNAARIEAETVHTRARTQVTAAQSRRTSRVVQVVSSYCHTSAINLPWLQKPSPRVPMYSLPGE